jgi:hypothetical protein
MATGSARGGDRSALADTRTRSVTLRRTGEHIFGRIGYGFVVCLTIVVWFAMPQSMMLVDRIELVAWISGMGWLAWLIAKARIVLTDDALIVVNLFVRWDIPWSAVVSVRAASDVQVSLADGRVIRPSIGGGSVIGQMRNNPVQNIIVSEIRSRRPRKAGDDTNSVRVRVDVEPIKFVISAAVLIALTVVFYYLRYR